MKTISVRVGERLYEGIAVRAERKGVSISEHVRRILEQAHALEGTDGLPSPDALQILRDQLKTRDEQLQTKDAQIQVMHTELAETRSRSDGIIMELTQHLGRAQLMLADSRQRRSLWQRIRGGFRGGEAKEESVD